MTTRQTATPGRDVLVRGTLWVWEDGIYWRQWDEQASTPALLVRAVDRTMAQRGFGLRRGPMRPGEWFRCRCPQGCSHWYVLQEGTAKPTTAPPCP